jgi:hypothetical protein
MSDDTIKNHAAFIWSVADLLRGDYKQSEYGKVIMPLVVLRRLDCVLELTKAKVLERHSKLKGSIDNIEPVLCSVSGEQFYNTSPLDFRKLLDDPSQIAGNLRAYIAGFSSGARDIIEKFDFDSQITKLDRANLLYLVISKFADVDLHPQVVSNLEMGYLYEELIRRFSELSNETAGEHFTPREVIKLMVNLLFIEDADVFFLVEYRGGAPSIARECSVPLGFARVPFWCSGACGLYGSFRQLRSDGLALYLADVRECLSSVIFAATDFEVSGFEILSEPLVFGELTKCEPTMSAIAQSSKDEM